MGRETKPRFGFYDAFCGIGAFHLAAAKHGGDCVGACDVDRFARETYEKYFKPDFRLDENIHDLTKLPDNTHFLLAGFPCPTFSLAGKSKLLSLGREHGLKDNVRGKLIFRVMELAEKSRPPVIILENVKHLLSHDGGRTIETILEGFGLVGYRLATKPAVLDAQNFGIPQHRQRVFIVLFRKDIYSSPVGIPRRGRRPRKPLTSILADPQDVDEKYILGKKTWDTLTRHKRHHAEQGNGFGYRLWNLDDSQAVSATISARYHKDGAEALVPVEGQERPRRLMPVEIKRLMGFPSDFEFEVSDTQAYRQLGNSIVVPVAAAVIGAVVSALENKNGELPFEFTPRIEKK